MQELCVLFSVGSPCTFQVEGRGGGSCKKISQMITAVITVASNEVERV